MTDTAKSPREPRNRDAARTRLEILAAATEEFAAYGYGGARLDEVALRTSTTKAMIHYYFSSKEGLYLAVLERVFREIREAEQSLDVTSLPPVEALRALAERSFDHHVTHREFVRLVRVENINEARYLSTLESVSALGTPILDLLGSILERGVRDGMFRDDVTPLDVHLLISAVCIFPESGGHTFGYLFGIDLRTDQELARLRAMVGDVVVRWLSM